MPATLTSRRFTVDEYYRMVEVGILRSEERVELIDGEIVRMASIGSRHVACVMRLDRIFQGGVGDRGLVLVQNPVRLNDFSEPEPDVAVLRPRSDDYASAHRRRTIRTAHSSTSPSTSSVAESTTRSETRTAPRFWTMGTTPSYTPGAR